MVSAPARTKSRVVKRGKLDWLTRRIVLVSLIVASSQVVAQTSEEACGDPFKSWFGPFDYRAAPRAALSNVETHHFTPQVEQLRRGVTTGHEDMGKDIAYVLGVFPNHHRALLTMMRMAEKDGNDQPRAMDRPVECYFYRALLYAKDDTVARLMYALWLRKKSRAEESLAHTRAAEEFAKDNPLTHYNVGISYFELGKYELAAAAARRALELGVTQPDLINRLKGVNQWTEPNPNQ